MALSSLAELQSSYGSMVTLRSGHSSGYKAVDYDQRAIKAEKDFRSLHFSDAVYFPKLLKLLYPVQHLVVDKLKEGNLLLEEGKEGREIKR